MQQFALMLYPNEIVKYDFINRDNRLFPTDFSSKLQIIVNNMRTLKLTKEQRTFIERTCPYFTQAYLDFLDGYKFNPDEVKISQTKNNLEVSIVGLWYRAILWEVPLMAIISELYFEMTNKDPIPDTFNINLEKAHKLKDISFSDFGTRRRYSFENHKKVITELRENSISFKGTSNLFFANEFCIKPVGTMAHELFSLLASIHGYKKANQIALQQWSNLYQGDLGIALPDTFTTEVFLRSFNKYYAKLFDGVRQDSGDPFDFAERIIFHYKELDIDPREKTIIFSDNLNTEKVLKIEEKFKGRIKTSYGIGTFLTNNIPEIKPLNIVIKLTGHLENSGWKPAIKLSDTAGKYTGDQDEITLCKQFLEI